MNDKCISRFPVKLPDTTFAEKFETDPLVFTNTQSGHLLLLTGDKVEGETGTATVTVNAILKDDSVVEGIPFLKKEGGSFKYNEITSDEINMADCPLWREYMVTDRMVAKYQAKAIEFTISAVENSQTVYCVILESAKHRYLQESGEGE